MIYSEKKIAKGKTMIQMNGHHQDMDKMQYEQSDKRQSSPTAAKVHCEVCTG